MCSTSEIPTIHEYITKIYVFLIFFLFFGTVPSEAFDCYRRSTPSPIGSPPSNVIPLRKLMCVAPSVITGMHDKMSRVRFVAPSVFSSKKFLCSSGCAVWSTHKNYGKLSSCSFFAFLQFHWNSSLLKTTCLPVCCLVSCNHFGHYFQQIRCNHIISFLCWIWNLSYIKAN